MNKADVVVVDAADRGVRQEMASRMSTRSETLPDAASEPAEPSRLIVPGRQLPVAMHWQMGHDPNGNIIIQLTTGPLNVGLAFSPDAAGRFESDLGRALDTIRALRTGGIGTNIYGD